MICVDGLEIGSFGEVHPAIQKRLDMPQKLFFAEISLEDLLQKISIDRRISLPSPYPSSERDWTICIRQDISFKSIEKAILSTKPAILSRVFLHDIYRGAHIREGYHNMTLRFIYQSGQQTLSQESVDQAHAALQDHFYKTFPEAILS